MTNFEEVSCDDYYSLIGVDFNAKHISSGLKVKCVCVAPPLGRLCFVYSEPTDIIRETTVV